MIYFTGKLCVYLFCFLVFFTLFSCEIAPQSLLVNQKLGQVLENKDIEKLYYEKEQTSRK